MTVHSSLSIKRQRCSYKNQQTEESASAQTLFFRGCYAHWTTRTATRTYNPGSAGSPGHYPASVTVYVKVEKPSESGGYEGCSNTSHSLTCSLGGSSYADVSGTKAKAYYTGDGVVHLKNGAGSNHYLFKIVPSEGGTKYVDSTSNGGCTLTGANHENYVGLCHNSGYDTADKQMDLVGYSAAVPASYGSWTGDWNSSWGT